MRFDMRAGLLALTLLAGCGDGGVMREIERAEKEQARSMENVVAESQAFLDENKARAGVEALPSGLLIEKTRESANASLPLAPRGSMVLVHYEGTLPDGSVFDSSFARNEPAQFPMDGVIPGFSEAIAHMRPGDALTAYIPADLGYGAEGAPPDIPGNSALKFRIELLAFQGPDGRVVQAPR